MMRTAASAPPGPGDGCAAGGRFRRAGVLSSRVAVYSSFFVMQALSTIQPVFFDGLQHREAYRPPMCRRM